MSAKLTIDTRELGKWVKREMLYTKKDLAEALNWHGFKICKAANAMTHSASKPDIRSSLMSDSSKRAGAPIAAILVNKKLGKGAGLYGQAMREAVAAFIRKRAGHVKYLGAGFLPGVAIFGTKVRASVGKNAQRWARAKQGDGSPVGGANVAIPSINPIAAMFNDAMAPPDKTTKPREAMAMKSNALQQAINQEVGNLEKYVARKIQQRNDKMIGALIR
jgi:hypothetical protein